MFGVIARSLLVAIAIIWIIVSWVYILKFVLYLIKLIRHFLSQVGEKIADSLVRNGFEYMQNSGDFIIVLILIFALIWVVKGK